MLYTFRYTFVADHYQYLASIGPIALVSAGLAKLTDSIRYGPRFLSALGILIFGALGLLTWRQSASYRDSETLWRTTIDRNPGCWMAENNLGSELLETSGDVEGAIAHFEKSLRLKFDHPATHDNVTYALLRKGDPDAAIAEAHVALNLQPNNANTHVVLGMALMTKGLMDEAMAQFSRALEIRPKYSDAHYNLAVALAEKHETVDAIAHYEKAIEVQPDFFWALTNLAWIFASSSDAAIRNGPRVVELAEEANRLTGGTSPLVLRTLAAAYATNKSFDKALETCRRALQSAQAARDSELAEEIRREMAFYEAGLPYRAP